jgi:hypothetical protein
MTGRSKDKGREQAVGGFDANSLFSHHSPGTAKKDLAEFAKIFCQVL